MMSLDIRTVLVFNVVSYLVCALFVAQLWWQNRSRFTGPGFWALNLAVQTVALLLISLRGSIPDLISIVLANSLMLAGLTLNYIGLERFVGKPGAQLHNYVLLFVFALALVFLTFVKPDFDLRSLVIAIAMLILALQCVWLLWHRVEACERPLTFLTGLVYFAFCALSFTRAAGYFVAPRLGNNYLQAGAFHALLLIGYQSLIMAQAYSLILMVNQRLLAQVRNQEQTFTKTFNATPYAITLTNVHNGTIVAVNDCFCKLSGYQRSEILGKKSDELNLWKSQEDHIAVVKAVAANQQVHGWEAEFCTKSGEVLVGLLWIETMETEGKPTVLTCIANITERKQAEVAMLENQERYRALVDWSPEAMGVHRDGRLIYVNPAALRMFGAGSAQELLGKSVLDLVHPDYRHIALARIQHEIESGEAVPMIDEKFLKIDGSTLHAQIQATPIVFDGAPAILVALHDVTERKRDEDAMRRNSEELERFNRVMVGRELDMIALKQTVNALSRQLGVAAPFALNFVGNAAEDAMKVKS